MKPIRLALVGLGKIARDQHLPAIAATTPGIELVAVASRYARLDGVDGFATVEKLLADVADVDAVALCTPPMPRRDQALAALAAGRPVQDGATRGISGRGAPNRRLGRPTPTLPGARALMGASLGTKGSGRMPRTTTSHRLSAVWSCSRRSRRAFQKLLSFK